LTTAFGCGGKHAASKKIREAKTNPSKPTPGPARQGFLKGRLEVPEDFDSMGREEIQTMYEGRVVKLPFDTAN